MAMLNGHNARSSLQVAPLTIQKTRGDTSDNASTVADSSDAYCSQMTPPATPNASQEDLHAQMEVPVDDAPVFHNFLRAFYPFQPEYVMTDSTVTLPLNEGDVVLVHSIHTNGWADGTQLLNGARGWLPTNYCEPYDPEEMRSLLKALLNFWDLMRATSGNDSEMFGNQEFMKGIIAGVRYLLERTDCLTRESPLVQRHDGLRRNRKSLLSELSMLVKTAKRLQEAQKLADMDEVNDVVDEMILRAFKIVTKGVRFLDILEEDRRSRIAVTVLFGDESNVPPTPPAESSTFDASQEGREAAVTRVEENGEGAETTPSTGGDVTRDRTPAAQNRLSLARPQSTNGRRLSQAGSLQVNRLSSTISHRISFAGSSHLQRPQNLISERLNTCHDIFLSHLGSFIGRLHLQSQSRPSLALAIKQSATSGGDLLVVVDIVCAHNSSVIDALQQSRAVMYDRIQDLVHTARDILNTPGTESELDEIVPQDNGRLLGAATGCVKATGECVAKTKWVIERIGDFEFEFDNGSLGVNFDLSSLAFIQEEKDSHSVAESASIAESTVSETTTTSTAISVTSLSAPVRHGTTLSIDKPLPEVPQVTSPISAFPDTYPLLPPSRPQSLSDDHVANATSTVSSTRADLPPLPRISTTSLPLDNYSPTEQSASHEGEYRSFRSESMTASSSGSGSTYLSRDSESSLVSQISTRATTPDSTQAPRNQPSLSDISITESATHADDVDDVESQLLEKTFAHELVFNKEGQVTGGSLAALVERLTTHESTPDAMFVSTFYLTFRLFCTPVTLAEALIERFDYIGEICHIAAPVRLRTYNVFKGWLESHWREETDHDALDLIKHFAEVKLSAILPTAGKRLLDLAEKVSVSDGALVPRFVSSMNKTGSTTIHYLPAETPLPAPALSRSQTNALANWKAGGTCPTILDLDPLEIARQLTMKQMALFCSIMPEELLGSKWTKLGGAGAPNVKAMSAFTTGLSNLVADTILQYSEVKKRAQVIKQWIKIASQCSALHNYDALMAITCALTDTSIKRLKMTWDTVSAKRKEVLKTLQATVDFNQNYKALRAQLHDRVPPCLPFLGMFLTDLTFVDVGNPATKTSDTGMTVINFDKHTRTAKSIGELQRFQIPYRLTEVPDLQEWLSTQIERVREKDKAGANTQASHYRKSLLLEPREVLQLRTPIETPTSAVLGGGMFSWMRGNSTSHDLTTPV
ncbi:ras guanine nucleotide exchange factor domain-containing protein [Podospora australis]|uniref:Ras guanine nucleotide exchange factor domain-containing protein n=1 Tax=Podospora australis TaxID=1536484 RepID=A0AAN7AF49_9PEZI|nr:ras guanine nucleotide exchange factor domain-containing protein [Podospora australis]